MAPDPLPHLLEHLRRTHEEATALRQALHGTATTLVIALSGSVALIGADTKAMESYFVLLGLSQLVFLLAMIALLIETNIVIHEGYMRALEEAANEFTAPTRLFVWNSGLDARFYRGFDTTIIWIDIGIGIVAMVIYTYLLASCATSPGGSWWVSGATGVLEAGFTAWVLFRLRDEGHRAYTYAREKIRIPKDASSESVP